MAYFVDAIPVTLPPCQSALPADAWCTSLFPFIRTRNEALAPNPNPNTPHVDARLAPSAAVLSRAGVSARGAPGCEF